MKIYVSVRKALTTLLRHNKRNATMAKMKCDCKVVYVRNPDVPQKALSKRSQIYVTGVNLK